DFDLPARHAIDVVIQLEPVQPPAPASASVRASTPPEPAERSRASTPAQPAEGVLRAPWPAPSEPSVSPSWWTWTLFGTSAALLAGAGALELSRRGLESDLERSEDQLVAIDRYDAMQGRATTARVLLGVGVVAGALGGVSLYLDLSRPSAGEPALAVGCDLGACGGFARGTW
ncbi:MAG: hypothetical protein ABW217_13200, partial [Polyangiaceae bacterium]